MIRLQRLSSCNPTTHSINRNHHTLNTYYTEKNPKQTELTERDKNTKQDSHKQKKLIHNRKHQKYFLKTQLGDQLEELQQQQHIYRQIICIYCTYKIQNSNKAQYGLNRCVFDVRRNVWSRLSRNIYLFVVFFFVRTWSIGLSKNLCTYNRAAQRVDNNKNTKQMGKALYTNCRVHIQIGHTHTNKHTFNVLI